MLRIVQAGLARKYINDELEKVARAKGKTMVKLSTIPPLTLEQLQAPFTLLLVLHGASLILLLIGKADNYFTFNDGIFFICTNVIFRTMCFQNQAELIEEAWN